jgi:hypothetical protein
MIVPYESCFQVSRKEGIDMAEAQRKRQLEERLEGFGDPRETWNWSKGTPDYVSLFSLTHKDVPQLLDLARVWVEREDWLDDKEDMTVYAPVHAWRALAQLKAMEAVAVLLEMTVALDKTHDDWHLQEFPDAFGMIGAEAIPALTAFLKDNQQGLYVRICVAHGLCEVAQRHEHARGRIVAILSQQLEQYGHNDETLNAFLICYLSDLRAVESAEVIERAFAADCVDITIGGDWNDIKSELGVEGLGLVPEKLTSQRQNLFDWNSSSVGGLSGQIPIQETNPHQQKKKLRQKRKLQRQNRKKGRRR